MGIGLDETRAALVSRRDAFAIAFGGKLLASTMSLTLSASSVGEMPSELHMMSTDVC